MSLQSSYSLNVFTPQALKTELAQLKAQESSGGALVTVAAPTGSLEELQQKLVSYQNFMAKYIVESQEAKIRAIADAQAATARKYEAMLLAATTALPPSSNTNVPSTANPAYVARNAQVRAAAASGKSRWGSAELQRLDAAAGASTKLDLTPETLPAAAPAPPVVPLSLIPPEVFAADHGLRADGGVGGLTLAERVVGGAAAGLNTASAVVPPEKVLYHQRNVKVAQTGSHSRWGPMEVDRAKELALSPPPVSSSSSSSLGVTTTATTTVSPDVVEKADHGLRADGGVGGPSLAERVNFGAQLLGVQ